MAGPFDAAWAILKGKLPSARYEDNMRRERYKTALMGLARGKSEEEIHEDWQMRLAELLNPENSLEAMMQNYDTRWSEGNIPDALQSLSIMPRKPHSGRRHDGWSGLAEGGYRALRSPEDFATDILSALSNVEGAHLGYMGDSLESLIAEDMFNPKHGVFERHRGFGIPKVLEATGTRRLPVDMWRDHGFRSPEDYQATNHQKRMGTDTPESWQGIGSTGGNPNATGWYGDEFARRDRPASDWPDYREQSE